MSTTEGATSTIVAGATCTLHGIGATMVPQPVCSQYMQGPRALANGLFHRMTGVNLGFGAAAWRRPKDVAQVSTKPPLTAHNTPAHWVQLALALFLIHAAAWVRKARLTSDEKAETALAILSSTDSPKRLVNRPGEVLSSSLFQMLVFLCDWYAGMCRFYSACSSDADFGTFVAHSPDVILAMQRMQDMVGVLETLLEAEGAYTGHGDDADILEVAAEVCTRMSGPYTTHIYLAKPAPRTPAFPCKSFMTVPGVAEPQDATLFPASSTNTVEFPRKVTVNCAPESLPSPASVFLLQTKSQRKTKKRQPRVFTDALICTLQTQDITGLPLFPLGQRLVKNARETLSAATASTASAGAGAGAGARARTIIAAIVPEETRTLVESMFPQVCTVIKVREEAAAQSITLGRPLTKHRTKVRCRLPDPESLTAKQRRAGESLLKSLSFDATTDTVWYQTLLGGGEAKNTPVIRVLRSRKPPVLAEIPASAATCSMPPTALPMAPGITMSFTREELLALRFSQDYCTKRSVVTLTNFARPSAGVTALLAAAEFSPCIRVPAPPAKGATITLNPSALLDDEATDCLAAVTEFFTAHTVLTVCDEQGRVMSLLATEPDTLDGRDGFDDEDEEEDEEEEGAGAGAGAPAGGRSDDTEDDTLREVVVTAFCDHLGDEVTYSSVAPQTIPIKASALIAESGVPVVPTADALTPLDPLLMTTACVLAEAKRSGLRSRRR